MFPNTNPLLTSLLGGGPSGGMSMQEMLEEIRRGAQPPLDPNNPTRRVPTGVEQIMAGTAPGGQRPREFDLPIPQTQPRPQISVPAVRDNSQYRIAVDAHRRRMEQMEADRGRLPPRAAAAPTPPAPARLREPWIDDMLAMNEQNMTADQQAWSQPTEGERFLAEFQENGNRRLNKLLDAPRGRTYGFGGQSAVRPGTEQRIQQMMAQNRLDAAQALQGRLPSSNSSGPAPDGQFTGEPPSQYDPAASTAHRDAMFDRWSGRQGAGAYASARNEYEKFSSPVPDSNGNMVDMPGIRIRSNREAYADRNEGNDKARGIRAQQRSEQLLNNANAQVRELRRKAGRLGMELSHYQFLDKNATPEEIRAAMDQGREYEAVLDNARKDRLRSSRQAQAEQLAQQQYRQRLGSLPLRAQMEIMSEANQMTLAREQIQARLEEGRQRNQQADRDTQSSAGVALIQAGVQTNNPELIAEGRAMLAGDEPQQQPSSTTQANVGARSATPAMASAAQRELDTLAPGLSQKIPNVSSPQELRDLISRALPNADGFAATQLYTKALNIRMANATLEEREEWERQEQEWSRLEFLRAQRIPRQYRNQTSGGQYFGGNSTGPYR